MMSKACIALLACLLAQAMAAGDDSISTLDELVFKQLAQKGSLSLVAGNQEKANEFRFDKDCQNVFFTSAIRGKPEWDKAAGFSFWVKGDGSKDVGALQFIYNDAYAVRYEYAFPLTNAEWHKVTVAWRELIPALPGRNSHQLDSAGPNKPSQLSALWVGKWWHWRDYTAHSFALDDFRLEDNIETRAIRSSEGLTGVREKLAKGKPITIVTMGDSLTDTRHWANRATNWPVMLKRQLEATTRSRVTIVNPAIGGTQLRQGLIQIPKWLIDAPKPDLITVCYGGNDWEAGMRGPQFLQTWLAGIDLIRQATHGESEVLVMTTVPAVERWETMAELADAARQASRQKKTGLVDLQAAFHEAGRSDRERLFVSDQVHLSEAGQKMVAESVLAALTAKPEQAALAPRVFEEPISSRQRLKVSDERVSIPFLRSKW
jgi:lysophospholipase L1-like esterase